MYETSCHGLIQIDYQRGPLCGLHRRFLAFYQSWELLPFAFKSGCSPVSIGFLRLFWSQGPFFLILKLAYWWLVRLFNGVDQLFNCFFDEVQIRNLGLLRLLDPWLDGEKSCLVQSLRFEENLYPMLLLPLQIWYDVLMVDEISFVFWEVLGADIFHFPHLLVILLVNMVVVLVNTVFCIFNNFL